MVEVAHAARGDHRHAHRIGHRAGEGQVKTGLGAVAVHAGQQDFTGAIGRHAAGPGHGVQPGGLAAAMGEDFPAGRFARGRHAARVDRHHHALRAVVVGGRADQFRIGHGGAVDADLVGAGVEQALDVGHLAHAAAHRQRDEDLRGHLFDDGQDQVAAIAGGGDVQEREFIGALLVVAAGDFDGVARVGQIHEVHALDDPPGGDVEAGDDAAGQRARGGRAGAGGAAGGRHFANSSARACAAWKSSVPS
ncbi:hypothetical protein FQZ97_775700 [compost metagenome]